jgi:hypothetical protein
MVVVDNAIDDDVVDNGVAGDVTIPSYDSYDRDNSKYNRLYLFRHYDVHHFNILKKHPCFLLSFVRMCFPCIIYNINYKVYQRFKI